MKILKFSMFLLILLTIFSACKDKDIITPDNLTEKEIIQREKDFSENQLTLSNCDMFFEAINLNNGKLAFENVEHFRNTLECLEAQINTHNEQFDEAYGQYDEDELEIIEDELNFNEDQPLVDC